MINKQKLLKRIIKLNCLLNILFLSLILNSNLLSANDSLSVTAERLKTHVVYLASEELEGRFPGTTGNYKAADYILSMFKNIGLSAVNNTYKQEFPFITGIKKGDSNLISFDVLVEKPGVPIDQLKPINKRWVVGEDWLPLSFSENGQLNSELVFVGYGITASDIEYDDYKDIDVKGKAVIVMIDSVKQYSKIKEFVRYSDLRYKASNAHRHGAAAVIFVKLQGDSANVFYPLKVEPMFKNSGIIALQANRTSISKFFPKNLNLYPLEQQINKTKKPKSFVLPNIKISLKVDLKNTETIVPNVLGMIKGTDPQKVDEYFVIGAHFDHLGFGEFNSMSISKAKQIHFGADDNASGTAGMIELADRISKKPLKHSVVFIGFNCEEEGLLGSGYYVKHPLLSLEKTDFMLNLDMIGRLKDNKLTVMGTGSSSVFSKLIDSLSAIDTFTTSKTADGFSPSDNSSFYGKKVPALLLFTGIHSNYHRPSDTWEKINFEGLAKVVNFAESVLRTLDNSPQKPDYVESIQPEDTTQKVEKKEGYGDNAWFGIVPTFDDNPKGFKIAGTSPGSPAEKAGLKKDDIISKIDDKPIKNLRDIMYVIREHKPGDTVKVIILRDDKEMTIDVTLTKRK